MKIAVIGVGPVGSVLAGHLAKNGEDVTIVDILKDHIDIIREEGLKIGGMLDLTVRIPKTCYAITEMEGQDFDVVFISTKASVLPIIIRELKKVWRPGMKVVSYQNGLDTETLISDSFGKENTLRVVVNYAGNFIRDGEVSMNFFHKPNWIGTLTEDNVELAGRIAAMMTAADLETEYTPDIRTFVWEKTILNGALSPVSALTCMTMAEVMGFPDTLAMVKELIREGIDVAEADGCEFKEGFFDHCVTYLSKAGHHKPSMLIDVENRSPTEIDFLNGMVCKHGGSYGVDVPVNMSITQLIRALDLQNKKAREAGD
jgi:2-dehydropantoate 2-reductase